MRITLDSSVLIAAYVTRAGVCAELLEDVLQRHELVLSRFILKEVQDKLTRKLLFPDRLVTQVVQSLADAAEIVEPAEVPEDACRDPGDLAVLGTAVAGDAELLVTVDHDLLDLSQYASVQVIRPGEYFSRASGSPPPNPLEPSP